jgi:ribonuclease D
MHIHPLITDTDSLQALCERLAHSPFVAVDTEFMRENTYWPDLCLIQIGDRTRPRRSIPRRTGWT